MKVKNIVKTTAAIAASLVLMQAQAATKGAYIGAGLGGSQVDATNVAVTISNQVFIPSYITTRSSTERYGIAGKLFGGYNFNQYFGLETNYQMYTRSLGKETFFDSITNTSATASVERSLNALDLVGKAYLPVEQFDLYALAGMAETFNKVKQKITTNSGEGYSESTSFRSIRPIVGVGANYNVNSNVTTGLEFTHIQGKGNVNTDVKAVPNANLLTLTAAYNFG